MDSAQNLTKLNVTENKLLASFQNTMRLLRSILNLTKKVFML